MLAGHLGMTLAELGERMTSSEFALWQEHFYRHPFGIEARQLAELTSVVANCAPFRDSSQKAFEAKDWLPKKPERGRTAGGRQTIEETKAFAEAIAAALGGV